MWYQSDTFDTLVRQTHTVCAKVEVWSGRNLIVSSDYDTSVSLIGGQVTINRTADSRRTCSLDIMLSSLSDYRSFFDPLLGYDIIPSRGIIYSDGTREYVPLGVFKADTVDSEIRTDGMTISLNGFDRSRSIAMNPWSVPFSIASGTEYTAAMQAIITSRASGFTPEYSMTVSANNLPGALFFTNRDNAWQQIDRLATAIGYDVFFDNIGVCVARPIVDPNTAPVVLDLTAGSTALRLGNLKKNINVGETYNGVIVRGSAPWLLFPVTGEAWDDDPASPTWRGGPFGARAKVIDNAVVTNGTQATAAAQAELFNTLGAVERISFATLPDPRLDVNDVVRIYDGDLGVYGKYVIESLTIPMNRGQVTGSVRLYSRSITK